MQLLNYYKGEVLAMLSFVFSSSSQVLLLKINVTPFQIEELEEKNEELKKENERFRVEIQVVRAENNKLDRKMPSLSF